MLDITIGEALELCKTFHPIVNGFGIAIENGNAIGYYVEQRGDDADAQVKKAV